MPLSSLFVYTPPDRDRPTGVFGVVKVLTAFAVDGFASVCPESGTVLTGDERDGAGSDAGTNCAAE